jgi:very-short-patch-repair endonuclease
MVGAFTLETRTQVSTLLQNAVQALKGVMTEAARIANIYESDEPHTHQDIAWILQVAEILKDAPVLEEHWITDDSFPDLIANARKLKERYAAYHSTRKALALRYSDSFFEVTEDSRARFEAAVDTLSRLIGGDLRHEATTLSYASQALRNVQALITYCKDWEEKGKEIAEFLEVPPPNTLDELTHVLFVEGICRSADPPDLEWMETRRLEEVERAVPSIQADFESRARTRAQLLTRYHESIFSIASTAAQFAESLRVSMELLGLEPAARPVFINHLDQLLAWAKESVLLAKEWAADATVISHTLGLPVDIRIEAFPTFIRIAELCDSPDRPAREWFNVETFRGMRQFLPGMRRDYEARQGMRAAFYQRYDDRLLTQDLDRLISDLSGRYSSWSRWLKPGFYQFQRNIRQYRRDGECPAGLLKDLLAGRDLLRIEHRIQEGTAHATSLLGVWYKGYETDFQRLDVAVQVCAELLSAIGMHSTELVCEHASFGSVPSADLRMAARHLKETLTHWERQTEQLASLVVINPILSSRLPLRQSQIREVSEWAGILAENIQVVSDIFTSVRKARRNNGLHPEQILDDVQTLSALHILEQKIETDLPTIRRVLGAYYRGYDSDFERIHSAMRVAKKIFEVTGGVPSRNLIHEAAFGSTPSPLLQRATALLRNGLANWDDKIASAPGVFAFKRIPRTGLPLDRSEFTDILAWASSLQEPLDTLARQSDTLALTYRSDDSRTPATILADLLRVKELRTFHAQARSDSQELTRQYGRRYQGLDTDWEDTRCALSWAEKLRSATGATGCPGGVLRIAIGEPKEAANTTALRVKLERFLELQEAVSELYENTEILRSMSDLRTLENRLDNMVARIDDLRDWVDYRTVEKEYERAGFHGLHNQLIKQSEIAAEQIPRIVRRALLHKWLDWVFATEHALGQFRTEDHEELIREFRDLDSKHTKTGAYRVIARAEEIRRTRLSAEDAVPMPGYRRSAEELRRVKNGRKTSRGPLDEEIGVLRHEAHKKTRHLPIRVLLAKMPTLLRNLKPCLLMSPLSVSQFLAPDKISFDLVIFDEASQILTEDAIGAIYRGRQFVPCGDSRQLPPTTFFEQGVSDEYDSETLDESFDVFESILDECAANAQFPTLSLRWHYRSRDESLIAFSNHRFYKNELVTFPGAHLTDPRLGIQFTHVPDGVYDRGGKRDNPREAQVVVDEIIQHCLERPRRSLGVVAFSVAQMNAIEDQVELLLRRKPEFEEYLAPGRLEGFFVKNLENVQGDERDVMIFSIGYAKDRHGNLEMRFGPLNISGGERRLNVAVTRAREKVILVSSLRAADFDLSRVHAPGVLALHQYLDYAERGRDALNLDLSPGSGGFESPLERDVAGAIRELGYTVVSQVGCSGYRIDLGVLDPANPGRFVLGVECDGATYHSAYTARDRDRLRQKALEDLGWRIHRVWSPDWVSRRSTEIRRLREVIEAARDEVKNHLDGRDGGDTPPPPPPLQPEPKPPIKKNGDPLMRKRPTTHNRVLDELQNMDARFENPLCSQCNCTARLAISTKGVVTSCKECKNEELVDGQLLQRLAEQLGATCHSCGSDALKSAVGTFGNYLRCQKCRSNNSWEGLSRRLQNG